MSLPPILPSQTRLPSSVAADPSRIGGGRSDAARPDGVRSPVPGAVPSLRSEGTAAAAPQALTAQAPSGVDPSLWNVLTTEERAQFSRLSAMGPLTYGPLSGIRAPMAPPPAVRGARLDIRA